MSSHFDQMSSPLSVWNVPLRIQRRGNFFSDDLFMDSRNYFESAARELLQEFDTSRTEDSFRSYRKLRDRQLSGTDRTTKVAEEETMFKIVMDVQGFVDEDLKVKIVGPNSIAVEGVQQSGGNGGTFSKRSFTRRFSLPGSAILQEATSVLSSDNILTVNVPKKVKETIKDEQSTTEIKNQQQQFNESVQTDSRQSSSAKDIETSVNKFSSLKSICNLPIVNRDSFFKDSFFENIRQNFQKSVDEMMNRRLQRIDSAGEVGIFRKVRESKEEDVQATSVSEDDLQYKIALDVHGFSGDDLQITAVSDTEIVIEGCTKKETTYTSSFHNFKKRFPLPTSARVQDAKSALSSDGILSIFIPKNKTVCSDFSTALKSGAADLLTKVIKEEHRSSVSESTQREKEHFVPVIMEGNLSEKQQSVTNTKSDQERIQSCSQRKEHEVPIELQSQNISSNVFSEVKKQTNFQSEVVSDLQTKEHQVPISVEGTTTSSTVSREVQQNVTCHSQDHSGVPTKEHQVPISLEGTTTSSTVSREVQQNVTCHSQDHSGVPTKEHQVPISLEGTTTSSTVSREVQQNVTSHSHDNSGVQTNEYKVPINVEGNSAVRSNITSEVHQQTVVNQPQTTSSQLSNSNQEELETIQTKDYKKLMESNQDQKSQEYYVPIVMDAGMIVQTKQEETEAKTTNVSSESQHQKSTSSSSATTDRSSTFHQPHSDITRLIPVSSKGSLYCDSIFEDARRSFEVEAQNALNRYKMTTIKEDVGSRISTQPSSQLISNIPSKLTSPTILDDDHYYKIVLDVYGYEEGEIKVKITGSDSISVEGSSERTNGCTSSKYSFHRSFNLPQFTDLERASTALSSEGILTITIPKKNQLLLKTEKLIPITSQIEKEIEKAKEIKTTLIVDSTGVVQDSKKEPRYPGLGSLLSGSTAQQTSSTTQKETRQESIRQEHTSSPLSIKELIDSESIFSESDSATSTANTSRSTSVMTTETEHQESRAEDTKKLNTCTMATRDTSLFNLPIVSKGHFFDDSFFQDSRPMFESALRNTMNRFSRSSSFVDDLGFFQSLRQGRMSESSNQIATVNEDDKFVKIVVDAHGFNEDRLKITVGCGNTVTIEGDYEEKHGTSLCQKSFRKSFTFPSNVEVTSATSALSTDGVLNIVIPKKSLVPQIAL